MSRIIVKGGLGNQMFQYALFMAIKSKSKNPKLDISIYKAFRMHNGFEINKVFNIELSDKELVNSTISNLSHRTISKFNLKQFELTDTLIFNPEVFTSDKLYINGYWQSELYFKDIEEIIRKQFTFKTISQENKDIAEEMRGIESVAIHIRRGDYVGTEFEQACPKDYYS
ncbi:MAG: alpha-1,2-fucosyltransferase, partial [Muribaculaceae bacterium]|nr:alpha-1,2-fucosyltransferase [Muribaculaceae bacterium]